MRSSIAAAVAAAALAGAPVAAADISILARATSIDARAALLRAGTAVEAGGRVACTGCDWMRIGITVSQRDTGAFALGGVRCRCGPEGARWTVRAITSGPPRFRPGRAQLCAWFLAEDAAKAPIDAYQRCRWISLRPG